MATWLSAFAVVPLASAVQLLSARSQSVMPPAGGNDNSLDSVVSPDGRFGVFSSAAGDIAPGDDRQFNSDVFLRDRASNTTVLVSINLAGTGGGNSHSIFGQVSTNGRYVVFQSDASDLVTNDLNGATDIFVRDLLTGTTRLVSAAANGSPAIGASSEAVMTPDGRYVAFVSAASNLVPGDTNGISDIFMRDLITDATSLVSTGAMRYGSSIASMATPVITPDGRYVAFFSSAVGLVSGVTNPPTGEVYVRDRFAGTTTWPSSNAAAIVLATFGSLTNYASYHPTLSDDGRYVAFKAGATKDSGAVAILQYDVVAGTTTVIDTNGLGAFPNDDPYGPEMTPDGRFIAYVHRESDSGTVYSSVHVWDSQTATDIPVSDDGNGVPANTVSDTPVLSADGRFVAFLSNATNLVGNAVSNGFHIYLRDLQYGTTQLVDADTNGVGSTDMQGAAPSLSADGRFVAFNSPDSGLVSRDNNGAYDVFLRDMVGGTNELISQRDPTLVPEAGNGITKLTPYSISADGRWVTFDSLANDLVSNDTNNASDVFAQDSWTGQMETSEKHGFTRLI